MTAKWFDRLAIFSIVLLLAWAPLVLGSNRLLPWIVNASIISFGFVCWCLSKAFGGRSTLKFSRVAIPLVSVGLVLIWGAIQWMPLGLEGLSNPIWTYAEQILQKPMDGRITANAALTELSLIRLTSYLIFAWLVLYYGQDSKNSELFLKTVIYSAFGYAFYGAWALSTGQTDILWFGERISKVDLTSTFVNRNSAATYFGMCALAATAYCYSELRKRLRRRGGSYGMSYLVESVFSRQVGLFFVISIMLWGALLLTHSRAGILSSLAALLVFVFLVLGPFSIREERASGSKAFSMIGVAGAALCGVVAILFASGQGLGSRLYRQGFGDTYRLEVYEIASNMISDYPLTGIGLGAFPTMMPFYPSSDLPVTRVWDKIHNSYLELIVGLGIPAAAIVLAVFGWAFYRCIKGSYVRKKSKKFPVIGICSIVILGIHSLVDFSIEIQAVALVFICLLSLGVAQSFTSRELRK